MNCDRIWLTCLALHNALLNVDGLSEQWQDGVRSNYQLDSNDEDVPFAIRRLVSKNNEKVYDFAGNGYGNDVTGEKENELSEYEDDDYLENPPEYK